MRHAFGKRFAAGTAVLVLATAGWTPAAEAIGGGRAAAAQAGGGGARQAGGGGGGARQVDNQRADARTNNVRSTSVNNVNASRNVNVNSNRNVNVNVESHGGCCGWDNDYHPVATAAAVTATVAVTSAVIGSMVRTVPPGCVPVNYAGMVYQQCGTTWYQPQGSQYVVVNPPY
ncbi:hypothetical protein CupriaWKF_28080 [Cupriavidus sp. WKF15]|uniref:hypothetical protein n=1 Tax=Cupriavidus sp. WKF15 TaxID=3032282 RepID=UPI0023E0B2EA|nr:hypothetical protein [Cupriavidus sp. WKF15]WER48629.1 hypothetical protein CupriaWKF_28080 [Cupriavidus sp. WKF15]